MSLFYSILYKSAERGSVLMSETLSVASINVLFSLICWFVGLSAELHKPTQQISMKRLVLIQIEGQIQDFLLSVGFTDNSYILLMFLLFHPPHAAYQELFI